MKRGDVSGGVQGVAWDLSDEYPAADAPELKRDLDRLDALQDEIEQANAVLLPLLDDAETLTVLEAEAGIAAARRAFARRRAVGGGGQSPVA